VLEHEGGVNCIAWNPVKPNLLLAGGDVVYLWDVEVLSVVGVLWVGQDGTTSLQQHPVRRGEQNVCRCVASVRYQVHLWRRTLHDVHSRKMFLLWLRE
jgi:WD40 repeat protein